MMRPPHSTQVTSRHEPPAFLTLGAIAALAAVSFWSAMPQTQDV